MEHIDINNSNLSESSMPEPMDFQARRDLIQDVIDRIINIRFGKDYYLDLSELNQVYSLNFTYVNGVRIYDSAPKESNAKNAQSKELLELGVQERAEIIQDVIDRITNKDIFVAYLKDLKLLHEKFSLAYKETNGVRSYEESVSEPSEKMVAFVTETPSSLTFDVDIYIALADGTKDISNFNFDVKPSIATHKETSETKVASSDTENQQKCAEVLALSNNIPLAVGLTPAIKSADDKLSFYLLYNKFSSNSTSRLYSKMKVKLKKFVNF